MKNEVIGHFQEKCENKYLVLDDIDKNKKVAKKHEEACDGIKKEIETINGATKIKYEKDFWKIGFESNDDLPMDKPIKLRLLTIIIRYFFREDDQFYPKLILDDALFDV